MNRWQTLNFLWQQNGQFWPLMKTNVSIDLKVFSESNFTWLNFSFNLLNYVYFSYKIPALVHRDDTSMTTFFRTKTRFAVIKHETFCCCISMIFPLYLCLWGALYITWCLHKYISASEIDFQPILLENISLLPILRKVSNFLK